MFKLLDGPQTLGRGRAFWACFLVVLAGALIYPVFADSYDVGNFSYFLIWIFMALGLCLMWGYGGMLSFGQAAYFGLGAYGAGLTMRYLIPNTFAGMAMGAFSPATVACRAFPPAWRLRSSERAFPAFRRSRSPAIALPV